MHLAVLPRRDEIVDALVPQSGAVALAPEARQCPALQRGPEGVGSVFGTEVVTGWSLPREGLPSQVDADGPRLARWAKFRCAMRDASSESGCSRDQEQPCPDDDGSDGSRDALTGRCETLDGDGYRHDSHHAKVHDPDDEEDPLRPTQQ